MAAEGQISCSQCGKSLSDGARFCDRCGTPTPSRGGETGEGLQPLRGGELVDGKWRIETKLGAGGMGSVFSAHDLALDRKVAIKALAPALCSDTEFVARFEREARMTARLEHPNIVPVYAVGRHFGRPFIVMKKLSGRTLSALLQQHIEKNQHFQADELLPLLRQLCAGLGCIHANGFVHRDLKPGNVFVGNDGHLTILDFGILRDPKSHQGLTRAGSPLGTPHYMAPEQATLANDADLRADLYSLGVIVYELLALVPPYEAPSAMELILMHAGAPPPDVRAHAPEVPPTVARALQRVLAKKPADRFQTAQAFLAAIETGFAEGADKVDEGQDVDFAPTAPRMAAAPLLDELPPPAVNVDERETMRGRPKSLLKAAQPAPEPAQAAPPVPTEPIPTPAAQRVSRRMQRPRPSGEQPSVPAQPAPESSEETEAEARVRKEERSKARKRKLMLALFVGEVLVVAGVLAWALHSALWPSASKADLPEAVAMPVARPVPTAPSKPAPKAEPKPLPAPGVPLDSIAPPNVELAPPPMDLKPADPLAPKPAATPPP